MSEAAVLAGLVLTAVGIILAVYYGYRSLRPKRLTYQATVTGILRTRVAPLRILVGDHEVQDPYLCIVTIVNRGSEVRPNDIFGDLELSVGRPVEAVDTLVVPPEGPSSEMTGSRSKLSWTGRPLINPGERVTIRIVTEGHPGDIELSWRIAGVRRIRMEEGGGGSLIERSWLHAVLSLIAAGVGLSLVFQIDWAQAP